MNNFDAAISDQNMAIQLDKNNEYAKGNLWLAISLKDELSGFEQNIDIVLGNLHDAVKKSAPDDLPLIAYKNSQLSPFDSL